MRNSSEVRVALVFKDFAYWVGYSSVGLNVTAITTAEELNRVGIPAQVIGVRHNVDLFHALCKIQNSDKPLTNVVIMAPWISPRDLESLLKFFPKLNFAVQAHTNVGALHGDFRGTGNLRNYMDLTFEYQNLRVAGNSPRFVKWAASTFDMPVWLLPNLYPIGEKITRKVCTTGLINIGAFGAIRSEKNFVTAVAAGLLMQKKLDCAVQFHINSGGDTSSKPVLDCIRQMTEGVPGFSVIVHPWMPWDKFRALVKRMDLLLQPSYTESFNMVTADGIVQGVPSVVSPAITWAPYDWKADSDDAYEIAETGLWLLEHHNHAREQGYRALEIHDAIGVRFWKEFLGLTHEVTKHWTERFIEAVKKLFSF